MSFLKGCFQTIWWTWNFVVFILQYIFFFKDAFCRFETHLESFSCLLPKYEPNLQNKVWSNKELDKKKMIRKKLTSHFVIFSFHWHVQGIWSKNVTECILWSLYIRLKAFREIINDDLYVQKGLHIHCI